MRLKQIKKRTERLLIVMLILLSLTGCGGAGDSAADPADVPAAIQTVRDHVTTLAADEAMRLSGEWGDWHEAMMASGQGRDYAGYAGRLQDLQDFQAESGASYVYTLYTDDPDADVYVIAMDAAADPDPFGFACEWEIQFKEAWEGQPAAARSAWDDDVNDLHWSAFAPIRNSENEVVAILGVDYPAPEILDYPEWNRDSDQWNHIEK